MRLAAEVRPGGIVLRFAARGALAAFHSRGQGAAGHLRATSAAALDGKTGRDQQQSNGGKVADNGVSSRELSPRVLTGSMPAARHSYHRVTPA